MIRSQPQDEFDLALTSLAAGEYRIVRNGIGSALYLMNGSSQIEYQELTGDTISVPRASTGYWYAISDCDVEPVSFNAKLAELRESASLSIAQLAEAAGMTRQAVDLLERGERKPSLETAERLAIALGKKLRVFEGCGIGEASDANSQ